MKQLKFFLLAFMALCFVTSLQAQDTKTKTKTKKENTAKHEHKTKYQCPMKCEGNKTYDHAGKCPVCNINLKAVDTNKAVAYQCPMKCEGDKTYAKEGKCPVCNMNLKALPDKQKKKDDGHTGHSH